MRIRPPGRAPSLTSSARVSRSSAAVRSGSTINDFAEREGEVLPIAAAVWRTCFSLSQAIVRAAARRALSPAARARRPAGQPVGTLRSDERARLRQAATISSMKNGLPPVYADPLRESDSDGSPPSRSRAAPRSRPARVGRGRSRRSPLLPGAAVLRPEVYQEQCARARDGLDEIIQEDRAGASSSANPRG
jgi:hypothetical protein